MNSGLFELIQTFVRVVETGSFTAVASEIGSTQPTVSRQIGALEAHLNVRLFNRTTRSLTLTEEGRSYYNHALSVQDAVEQAEAAIRPGREHVTGTLRIAGPLAFTRLQVIPRLKRFLERWPEVSAELVLNDRAIDLVEEGIDVGIRIGEITDESLIARRIGETRRVTVAAPEYLHKRKRPDHPGDLVEHDCIVFSGLSTVDEWVFANAATEGAIRVKVSGPVKVNVSEAVQEAVMHGLGIAVVPTWVFRGEVEEGSLIRILDEFEPAPLPIHVVYPSRRMVTPRARAFIDYLIEEFRNDPVMAERSVHNARADQAG